MAWLLVGTIFLPLFGAALMGVLASQGRRCVRAAALAVALATLAAAAVLLARFTDGSDTITDTAWTGFSAWGSGVRFSVGLDGLGIWLFGLTALLMVSSVLVSWEAVEDRPALFYGMLLTLEFGCLGVFAARDIILFYVFFEFTLIPLFFLIGIWGSRQRRYAAMKFFLFTLTGSVLTFLGLLAIVFWNFGQTGSMTFSIPGLVSSLDELGGRGEGMPIGLQVLIFLALFIGFAIKVPLFPLHTWLPLAHVEAPTAGSVFLAGILLKIGAYGFVRFSIPMLPDASAAFMPYLLWLSAAGIIYGALVALAQRDIKRLIAYSSVSHMGFCVLGLFALNRLGIQGGVLQMINHGISTGALFALVGMIYERYHTREIRQLGGLARRAPWLAFFMLLFALSSIGLPGLNGFTGEFLLLVGMFQRAWSWGEAPAVVAIQLKVISVAAVAGVVLGAWYMLWLVQRVFFGPLREPVATVGRKASQRRDLSAREILALAPLAVFVVWIGVHPQFFLRRMAPALDRVTAAVQRPLEEYGESQERTAANALTTEEKPTRVR